MVTIKKWARIVLGGCLLLSWQACTPPGPSALLRGEKQIAAGNYADAVESLREAVTLLPNLPQAWNHLGLAYHYEQKFREAVQAYRKALELDYNLAPARFNLGSLLLEFNHAPAAANEFAAYTILKPDLPGGWVRRGLSEWRANQWESARASLQQALRLKAEQPDVWNSLGMIELYRKNPVGAQHAFKQALAYQADYPPALYNAAIVSQFYLPRRPVDHRPFALKMYRNYLQLPERPLFTDTISRLADRLNRELNPPPPSTTTTVARTEPPTPEAKPEAKPASPAPQPKPESVPAPAPKPATETAAKPAPQPAVTNQTDRAVADTTTTANQRPTEPARPLQPVKPAGDLRPTTQIAESRPPAPKPTPAPAPTPAPTRTPEPEIVEPQPVVFVPDLTRLETPDAARMTPINVTPAPVAPAPSRAARPAPRTSGANIDGSGYRGQRYAYLNPRPPSPGFRHKAIPHFDAGRRWQRLGRNADAITAFRQSIKWDGSFFEAYHNLGMCAANANDFLRAAVAFETALALNPASVLTRYHFSDLLSDHGYHLDAAIELQRIVRTAPDNASAHLKLANIYDQRLGQSDRAREHYQAVLRIQPSHPQGTKIRYWLRSH